MKRLAAAALIALVLSACTADATDESVDRPAGALSWNADLDLEGAPIAVGSGTTVEQQILGHLALEALAATNADVVDQLELGSTLEVRDAQLGGLIDLYWEYTGTAWVELLREIGPSDDAEELAEAVAETDLDENEIAWLPPAPANAGFVLVRGPDLEGELDVDSLSELGDLLEESVDGAVICVPDAGGFLDDPEGLRALSEALDAPLRDGQVVPVPAADLAEAVEVGLFCPYGQLTGTSTLLAGADLDLLEDDVGAFLIRSPGVTVRAEVLADHPAIEEVLAPVAAALDDDALRDLNAEVVVDGRDAGTVARDWLVSEGLADR